MTYSAQHLAETLDVVARLDHASIEQMAEELDALRERGGRLFIIGIGGSAANASHAVCDFRKLCDIEAYAPSDNMAEFSARTNDNGFRGVFAEWLTGSRMSARDALLVLSVGGGMETAPGTSVNIAFAVHLAKRLGTRVLGIVGRDGGYTKQHADVCVLVPTVNPEHVTPHSEAMQAVIWHLLVSHPKLKKNPTKW
jgi:D-sedoheptulose 7-phosphate isomerase